MFLKSKYEQPKIINTNTIQFPEIEDFKSSMGIIYYIHFGPSRWMYDTKRARDDEYDWVVSQLEVIVRL